MQTHYEINVAERVGKDRYVHLFATHERSCVTEEQLRHVLLILRTKFPDPVYQISVTHRTLVIEGVDMSRIGQTNQEKRKHTPSPIVSAVRRIRNTTNCSLVEAKQAYDQAHGNEDLAIEIIRRKGTTGSNDFYLGLVGDPPIDTQE